ncbi:MAG: hypothetical protein ABW022_04600 [Actinoplanes sp.]
MPDDLLLDPAASYPEVSAVRAAMAAHDWTGVRAVLDAAPPAGRTILIGLASEADNLADFLGDAVRRDPADSAAAAMLGSHLIDVGWKIRTAARAQHVSAEQFASFHQWLRRAEAVLMDGIARNPTDPALWTARLTSARGLQLGLAETRRRYDKLVAADPHHLPGQMQFLQRLCPKWSGSWEMLHAWCRETMQAAPPGAQQGALVAEGHLEHMLASDDGVRYLTSEPARTELYEAAYRSVWHADFRREPGWVSTVSTFAMLFSLIDDQRAAASLFAMLGNLGSEHPWDYLADDPAAEIKRRRTKALSAAGGTR